MVATKSLQSSLEWLDRALVRPFRKESASLVIVPTGALSTVPWGSLPSLQQVPVVVTPSATSWVQASADRPADDAAGDLVASIAGPGLTMAEEEAATIAKVWGDRGHAILGSDASQAAFIHEMAENDVLHVAAHGRHQTDSPLFSSIQLADGPFFAFELDQGSRVPAHVVLAACDLGLATMRPGDEALGLTSVLLHWGSRCVVAGVARVADEVSAAVMVDYHRRLASGTSAAVALADAVAANDSEVPVPFVCFGADYTP
jgi:CHAT domain-containing protein